MSDQTKTEELDLKKEESIVLDDSAKKEQNQNAENTDNHFPKMSFDELVRLMRSITDDTEFWQLTYMQSTEEFVCLNKNNKNLFLVSPVCEETRLSKCETPLHDIAKCVAARYYRGNANQLTPHPVEFKRNFDNPEKGLRVRCSGCVDNLPACPYSAAAFIKGVCASSDYSEEAVYEVLAAEKFQKMEIYRSMPSGNVEYEEEYEFLDKLSVITAMVFIKERWIDYSETEDSIIYRYVDFFKYTNKSMFADILDLYRGRGTTEHITKDKMIQYVQQKRNPADITYVQDPDKVAAYILYLAKKHDTTPMVLCANLIQRLSRTGNVYSDVVVGVMKSSLHNLPFQNRDLKIAENVFNYIVNYGEKSSIPYMPINAIIYSKDDALAQKLIDIYEWALMYERYFKGYSQKSGQVKTVSLADYDMDAIVDMINSIRPWDDKDADWEKHIKGPIVLHIKDMEMLPAKERRGGDNVLAMAKLVNAITRKQDFLSVMISGEKDKLERVLKGYSEFYNRIMLHKITIDDMPVQRIVYELNRTFTLDYALEDGFAKALENYVIHRYNDSDIRSRDLMEVVKQEILFNHYNKGLDVDAKLIIDDIPKLDGKRDDQEIWKEINSLQGLDNIKDELRKLQNMLKFRNKATTKGINGIEKPSLHMVFAGNPGTGKTTVARLLGDMLYNFGYIKQRKLIEVSPKELIAPYVGQTAPRTAAACESAYGGILFIDEAYELAVTGHGNTADQFRSECVTELIKQMEDHRDNLVVIFAGYTEEMDQLLDSNAGFASRIGNRFTFEDYSDDELFYIYRDMVQKAGLVLADDVRDAIYQRIADARDLKDFGNARFMRNLFEKTLINHAENTVYSEDDEVLFTITVEDIPDVDTSRLANKKVKLGF